MWWRNRSLFGTGKLMRNHLFLGIKKYIKRWGKILNISDYGMLWVAFIKGVNHRIINLSFFY